MKNIQYDKVSFVLVSFFVLVLTSRLAVASVSGPCSSCHTMHNSQDGAVMGESTPQEALLTGLSTCIGCHTGTNGTDNTPAAGDIPYIMDTNGPGANSLAGGNFYWVTVATGNDSYGHNVAELPTANIDDTLGNKPPGGTVLTAQITCAGVNGCHGDRGAGMTTNALAMAGYHHGQFADNISYRFLAGIDGVEDSDWEYQATNSAHNQYRGVARTSDLTDTTSTISSFCGQCHGDFHKGDATTANTGLVDAIGGGTLGTDPWIRHPVDFAMDVAVGAPYGNYNDVVDGTNKYSVLAPVASTAATAGGAIVSNVTANNDAIVMCMSCHRAHASPYADILRWDYSNGNCEAGTADADCGCYICHTDKD